MRGQLFTALALVVLAGCTAPKITREMLEIPPPAAEMAQLKKMVGTWEGTAEMVSPTPEKMQEMMEEGLKVPASMRGGGTSEMIWDGAALHSEGWHQTFLGDRAKYVEFTIWDPKIKKFRSWYIGSMGERGESTWSFSEDGKTMNVKGKGYDPHMGKVSMLGTATFLDDDTMEWTWTQKTLFTKFQMKGRSHRKM